MGLAECASLDARITPPQPLSTEDRKIGRVWGFTRRAEIFGATEAPRGRPVVMTLVQKYDDASHEIIAACIEVHRQMGPGLLESIYEGCLCRELTLRGLSYERQKAVSVDYKGTVIDQTYRVDLVVAGEILVEVKAVETLLPLHAAQVVTYLRVLGVETGLLVNFNALTIRDGLRRLSRTHKPSDLPIFCK